ncbi:MAG: UDP-N-acetylglucosamine--N-acetylmuramyl-(pentapeptide) pyrophosphoryl-undecaprenol N-acetylglucosamine transferase [Candidatus Saccharimonadales bacterium]
MKLLAAGGGSGGHVTPVLAVINELAELDDRLEVRFICDRAFESQSRGLMKHANVPVEVATIPAGKLRRYHGESLWRRLTDIHTIALNIRDILKIIGGFFKSLLIIGRFQPDVVFAKGGFVCLPLGIAARLMGVPIVIHDSDTRPGLTNSVLGKFADRIATGSPLENYRYPAAKSRYTGVPINEAFHPLSSAEQQAAKASIGMIDITAPLVVVTGGGLGAKSINDAMVRSAKRLIAAGIHVYHVTGKKHFDDVKSLCIEHPHYMIVPFVYKDMVSVLGAGDIVVSRASATFLQELAGLAKPAIVVPGSQLGDQVKNAAVFAASEAVIVLRDKEIGETDVLGDTILAVLKDSALQHKLSQNLHRYAKPNAAADVAAMIIDAYKVGKSK